MVEKVETHFNTIGKPNKLLLISSKVMPNLYSTILIIIEKNENLRTIALVTMAQTDVVHKPISEYQLYATSNRPWNRGVSGNILTITQY